MSIEKFIENFGSQLDETEISSLTPATEFKSLDEWSSLTALSIIAMADEEYDVKLKGDDLKNAISIQQLYELVISRKA